MVWWSKWETLIKREEIELEKFEVNGIFFSLTESDRKWEVERGAKH